MKHEGLTAVFDRCSSNPAWVAKYICIPDKQMRQGSEYGVELPHHCQQSKAQWDAEAALIKRCRHTHISTLSEVYHALRNTSVKLQPSSKLDHMRL
jgi:hypothetical protein